MTLPDKSCPTFGIAPGTGLKLFVEGDLILEELVMLKFSIDDWCCNCPGFPVFVPAENMLAENVDLPPNAGVEITDGLTFEESKLVDPNIFGILVVLSWDGRVDNADGPLLIKLRLVALFLLLYTLFVRSGKGPSCPNDEMELGITLENGFPWFSTISLVFPDATYIINFLNYYIRR